MAKIMVDISDKSIDATLKKHVKSLEKKVQRLQTKNDKLTNDIKKQNLEFEKAKRIVLIASEIAEEFRDEWIDES